MNNYSVVELFEIQANKTPFHIAISDHDNELTYKALNEKANQFASWLAKKKVKPGDFVGILFDPGIDYIICMLAISKAGAAYLPLDTLAPKRRLTELLSDANPKLVITNEQYLPLIEGNRCELQILKNMHLESVGYTRDNSGNFPLPTSLIYMMYTSGSTGIPKGVLISHQAVVNLVKTDNFAKVKENERVGQFSNLAFDASTFEIWSALLNGASLVIVPSQMRSDPSCLKRFFKHSKIKYLFLPTGFFHQLIKSTKETLNSIEVIIFGGEQVNTLLLNELMAYRRKSKLPLVLINGYGPSEATTFTCRHVMDENGLRDEERLASIGNPIANVKLYILDENKTPTSEGELYISGINLAFGYHKSSLQNEEKFISNPFCAQAPFDRLYRTGDLVRMLSTGELLYLGRLDDQVKIGGFRIHLNEIENQLMQHPLISLAAVRVEIGGGSHKMLTAYIVRPKANRTIHADEVRQFLSNSLPIYMLPAKYVLVNDLPLTSVGKVDKAKLDQIPHVDLPYHEETLSSSLIEEKIKLIWQDLLKRTSINVNKNLFELGANSLLITEACFRINEELQSELQVANFLSYPTIHKLSRYLDGDIDLPFVKEIKAVKNTDIAIIGMACRFPKAKSLAEFWENLCLGKDCLERFSEEQLAKSANNKIWDKNFVPVRGILADIDQFDANFFGFNPIDASITDPQQRLFLECTWEALEHACVAPEKIPERTISVFAGMADSTYLHENLLNNNWFNKTYDRIQTRIASSSSMLSTQVSYRLNLRGRSINVNTACSTGLVVVSEACQDLISGHSDIAIAGAVSIVTPQEGGYLYQRDSIESPDGKCRPFAANANGTVFSNGVGVVVLKRLADAIADKDTIYAVIKGKGINNDGSDKLGFAAPSTSGQTACIRNAFSQARLSPREIGYVEAHGTATALGDAVEFDVLSTLFREQTEAKQFCALGSVKGNIGHADIAAGMAGLLKVTLCLYHQKIPPTLYCDLPNPNIRLNESPFFINSKLIAWESSSKRYAGVSSFGVGGTNAHLILGEYSQKIAKLPTEAEQLFILSAKSARALEQNTTKLSYYLSKPTSHREATERRLADIAHTLQTGREDFQWRRFAVGKTIEEINSNLSQKAQRCGEKSLHNLIFMFPGQGMQYHAMASQLIAEIPAFAELVRQGAKIAESYLHCDLIKLLNNANDDRLHQTQYAQPALFIIEYALASLLIACGIKPYALIGHSLGEYVAACIAGVFSFEEGVALICQRGLIMANAPRGAMLAISCSLAEFAGFEKKFTDIELSLHNAPNHCVASGDEETIVRLEEHLANLSIACQKLQVSHAFHSRFMEAIEQPFKEIFQTIPLAAPLIPILSNLTGSWLTAEEARDPEYWYRQLRRPVQLCKGLDVLIADENPLFIEVGPGFSLSTFLKLIAQEHQKKPFIIHTLASHQRQTSDLYQFLTAIGTLWREGLAINWQLLNEKSAGQHIPLPAYSFQKRRYWVEPDDLSVIDNANAALYKTLWSSKPVYKKPCSFDSEVLKKHSWIIFKDNSGLAEQFISMLREQDVQPFIIEQGEAYCEKGNGHFCINVAEKTDYDLLVKRIHPELIEPYLIHSFSYDNKEAGLLSTETIDKQLDSSLLSLMYLVQACSEHFDLRTVLRCAVLTQGAQQVLGIEPIIPANASLVGALRVINQEHPSFHSRLFDLSPTDPFLTKNLVGHLIVMLDSQLWSTLPVLSVYRNGFLWESSYAAISSETNNPLKDNGIYLLTGGLGGMALTICEAISEQVANPTFILLTRSALLPESEWNRVLLEPLHKQYKKIRALRSMQAKGARFDIHQADINDLTNLYRLINQCIDKFGGINGLMHCAGIAGRGVIQFKSREQAKDVLAPKVQGTYNLALCLKEQPLDFVMLMSSIAALTGELGQFDYCAANACLDAFAQSDLFLSNLVISLNWNTWQEVGMAVETERPADISFFERENDISPLQGKRLFLQALQANYSNLVVSNYAPEHYAKMVTQHAKLVEEPIIKTPRKDLNVTKIYQPPRNAIEEELALLWEENLGIEAIGIEDDFFELGGHSLRALNLIEKINHCFQSFLSINQLYRTPTIKKLAAFIISSDTYGSQEILVPLKTVEQRNENLPCLFVCHPASGLVYRFNSFVSQSTTDLSVYGLQDPSIDAGFLLYDSVEMMAKAYMRAIKTVQPTGSYYLIGYSFGGNLVYEIARMLRQENKEVALLALIESWALYSEQQFNEAAFRKMLMTNHNDFPVAMINLAWSRMKLLLAYTPSKFNQEMLLFKASEVDNAYQVMDDTFNCWSTFNKGNIICHSLNANHETILDTENSKIIADIVQKYCKLPVRLNRESV